jgi:1-acyl-sn-glycerol-3-phosphate acyltransferase
MANGEVIELPQGRHLPAAVALPAPARPTSAPRRTDVDPWGRSESARSLARRVLQPVYDRWFRVTWEGLEHLPATGGALLVANHAGALPPDAPAIMHGIEQELGRPVYGLGHDLFRTVPFVGTAWQRMGGVVGHPDNAFRLLHDDGQLVLVFPEGAKGPGKPVSQRYQLRRFGRGGFVEIAMRAGAPVIPIAVVGAEEAMPVVWNAGRLARRVGLPYLPVTLNHLLLGPVLGSVAYLPAKFRIRVLEPVHLQALPGQERYSRAKVMEASDLVRERIQLALYDMLRERRSIWFG